DAFGNMLSAREQRGNPFRYAGEMQDALTGHYYLRARFYNPQIARFTQEDTYRGDGLNLYAYVANNPIRYVDPSGYMCEVKGDVWGALPKPQTATQRRNSTGTVTGGYSTKDYQNILIGTHGNVGRIPSDIAVQLQGKTYKNFSDFQKSFWKAVSNSKYAEEFSSYHKANSSRMKGGNAPFADKTQQTGTAWPQMVYNIHHKTPISKGGAVFDLDNLLIVAPRTHAEILEVNYHGFYGFKRK
ncbi:RHS repeat-associated core domain-containing protein, partial [Paenibacillus tundrae]|uniref:RHS repeat-associated core domain-containing protein n=1 Tax=Paenibacillus tundrae TaxID=528187 RepID=UPI0027D8D835